MDKLTGRDRFGAGAALVFAALLHLAGWGALLFGWLDRTMSASPPPVPVIESLLAIIAAVLLQLLREAILVRAALRQVKPAAGLREQTKAGDY